LKKGWGERESFQRVVKTMSKKRGDCRREIILGRGGEGLEKKLRPLKD